jgi:hypothetical protein
MEDTMEMQDFVITDTWTDKKTGEEVSQVRKIGVSFKMKGGGWRHKLYRNVSVSGEAMSLPQRKPARARFEGDDLPGCDDVAGEPESGETGDGYGE